MLQMVRMFDDRPIDFRSGKRVSLPYDEMKNCDCCGVKISKGVLLNNGHHVGNDCYRHIKGARFSGVDKHIKTQKAMGWDVKKSVREYLLQHCPA